MGKIGFIASQDNCEVKIGNTVTVTIEPDRILTFIITIPKETDPSRGAVSYESPIGTAMLNKRAGDSFQYAVGAKTFNGKVVKIGNKILIPRANITMST